MALVAWYPLNGGLEDYSGNNRHLEGENIVVSNQGKIGKCLEFNANPIQKVYYKEFPRFTSNFTWSCWVNVTALGSTRQMILSQGRDVSNFGINIITDPSGGVGIVIGTTWKVITYDLVNKWTHLALAVDTSKVRLYINGVLQYETNKTEINFEQIKNHNNAFVIGKMSYSYTSDTTYFPFNGKVNDVRIYDEALSLKEIKEIAKAKILHYNFNQFAESTTNLANFIGSTMTTEYSWLDERCPLTGEKVLKLTRPTTVSGYLGFTSKISSYKPNTKYSYTIWYRVDKALSQPIRVYCIEWDSAGQVINYRHHISIQGATNGWVKQTATWTSDALVTRAPVCNVDWFKTASTTDDTIYIGGLLLEEKDHCTQYVNNTRIDRVTDSSGFRNHSLPMQPTTAPQWTAEGVLGSGCYSFGDSKYICIGNKCKPTESITVSAWAYKTNWSSDGTSRRILSCTEGGGWQLGFNDSAGYVSFPFYKAGVGYYIVKYSRTNLTSGWHLLTGTFDGRYGRLYVDGELKDTVDTSSYGLIGYHSSNGIFIGAESGANETEPYNGYFDGKIDDVRIYATALSEEDIKEIYNVGGSVFKNGKVMTNEIVEIACSRSNLANRWKENTQQIGWSGSISNSQEDSSMIFTAKNGWRVFGWNIPSINGKDIMIQFEYKLIDNTNNATVFLINVNEISYGSPILDLPSTETGWIKIKHRISSAKPFLGINIRGLDNTGLSSSIKVRNVMVYNYSDEKPTQVNRKHQLISEEFIEYPSANLETKTAYGADWVQLFYHNNQAGTVLFTSDKQEFLKCNTSDKISNLYLMELFRGKDGKFEFLLEYQSGDTSYNRWKQTSNFTNELVVGYEPIQCSWTNNYWGGLEPSNNTSTWVDGSVSHGNWFYAIGGRVNYGTGGLPSWNGVEPGWVKIWVRCDNPSVFKMYKNGTVSATEFIEN